MFSLEAAGRTECPGPACLLSVRKVKGVQFFGGRGVGPATLPLPLSVTKRGQCLHRALSDTQTLLTPQWKTVVLRKGQPQNSLQSTGLQHT